MEVQGSYIWFIGVYAAPEAATLVLETALALKSVRPSPVFHIMLFINDLTTKRARNTEKLIDSLEDPEREREKQKEEESEL